ncbi:CRISPR-associated protein [uncultured Mitsuokella sp.]|uniref:CRISPR-associated protein n=1 Tax=uncultured Mitsuokella sp. TaxID=453120 RepID=UPI002628B0C4|nr:CRISPR-associated protein [uncultured Mitsuokella sp.]
MGNIFINHTNHCSSYWSEDERRAAQVFGEIVDVAFPAVSSSASEEEIEKLAHDNAVRIIAQKPAAVLCQGEYTYTYALVKRLLAQGICVVAACSERVVEEQHEPDGSTRRISQFRFTRFRRYG